MRTVYNDPVVKYGFARRTEPVDYVERIMDRFEHCKAFIEKEPAAEPEKRSAGVLARWPGVSPPPPGRLEAGGPAAWKPALRRPVSA